MASIPSKRKQWKWKAKTPTISCGTQQHVARETMPAQLNNEESVLIQMDANPHSVGCVILLKGKSAMACSQNLTQKTRHTATKDELHSIITRLRAQPNLPSRCKAEVHADN
jgi:hypothetical protein